MSPHLLRWTMVLVAGLLLLTTGDLSAAKIGELSDTRLWEQLTRFFSLRDPAVRYTLIASLFLGTCCGLLGSFIVVRKLSLMGDTLSHAVLPGVALGFLWTMTKNPWAIFIGASIAGLLGTVVVHWIHTTTHIKEDSAMGLVLSGFYALGICLFTMIQQLPTGNKAGLDKFMFGQAAALSPDDLWMIGIITTFSLLAITLFYKEFLVTSFDFGFAQSMGLSAQFFHYLIMLLLALSVVIALQAVGIVLVSALLITPAATAFLLTDRMRRMLLYASLFGMGAGVAGAFLSYLGNSLPTGPFIIVAASAIFALALLFGHRYGIVPRWVRNRSRDQRIQVENTLKAVYHVRENDQFSQNGITLQAFANRRKRSLSDAEREIRKLVARGLATFDKIDPANPRSPQRKLYLTPAGWETACRIVRNHRLWELYLTESVHYQPDHVHDDAEEIEHLLGEDTVRQLERRLNYPTRDPHGKLIPSLRDLHRTPIAGPS